MVLGTTISPSNPLWTTSITVSLRPAQPFPMFRKPPNLKSFALSKLHKRNSTMFFRFLRCLLLGNVVLRMKSASKISRKSTCPTPSFRSLIIDVKDCQAASEQRSEGNPPSMTTLLTGFDFHYRHAECRVKPVEQHAAQIPLASVYPSQKVAPPTTTTNTAHRTWGKPTAQTWIGSPVEDIHGMFPCRITGTRSRMFAKRLAVEITPSVYFHSMEDAQGEMKSLNHPKIKFGLDCEDGLGSYGAKRGSAFIS